MRVFKYGNHKIGDDTIIFNINSSLECASRKLGLCPIVNKDYTIPKLQCYARKAEIQYKDHVLEYRQNQHIYWISHSHEEIVSNMIERIRKRRKQTTHFRFNECGDFENQEDIEKISKIAEKLREELGIVTYGFTARRDLDYSNIHFLLKGSNFKAPNGQTTIIGKNDTVPEGYVECTADCRTCNWCKEDNKINIAFRKH